VALQTAFKRGGPLRGDFSMALAAEPMIQRGKRLLGEEKLEMIELEDFLMAEGAVEPQFDVGGVGEPHTF